MKRYCLLLLLIICISALLCSCILFRDPTPWEEGKQKDTPFSNELISEMGLTEMPMPSFENSYLSSDGSLLYCNMTREEYLDYVQSVVDFLKGSEELYNPGYRFGYTHRGVFLLLSKIDEFAPLIDGYNVDDDSHRFIYAIDPEVEYGYEYGELTSERFISVDWCPTTPKNSEFSYTVEIKLDLYEAHTYHFCYHEHDVISRATYPVPGTDKQITIFDCSRCAWTGRTEYLDSGNREDHNYEITVVEGEQFVVGSINDKCFSNITHELRTIPIYDAELRVLANGTEIPRTSASDEYWGYRFIMPGYDVEITIEIVGDEAEHPYFTTLSKYEPWLDTINAENITKVRVVTEKLGAPEGSLRNNQSNLDSLVISSFLSTLKNKTLMKTSYENIENAERLRTVEFIMFDGTVHSLCLYDDIYYSVDGIAYEMKTYPSLLGYVGNTYSYSFETDETAEVRDAITNEKVGEIALWKLEFIEYNFDAPDEAPQYRVETEFGTIYVYSSGIFSLESDGKVTFYQLHVDIFTC